MKNETLQVSAAGAGMSERAARKWQKGLLPSERKRPRTWRTRQDPFAEVWEAEVAPLLGGDDAGIVQATTIIQLLEERYPGCYSAGQVRTLQRRIRDWRALYGPAKEAYFEQQHVAGREAAIDFTSCTELGVRVAGSLFRHLLFQFVLSFSGWRWVTLAFGETYEALVAGVQAALWELGGVPEVLRSDNLSAATHALKRTAGRMLNERFRAVLDHYGMISTRIRPGQSHENGIVEQAHHRLKSALAQALLVRGSKDFVSVDAYMQFVQALLDKQFNRPAQAKLAEERRLLRPLPSSPIPSFTTYRPIVRKWSTIRIIWSLVRKPGAFARYKFREDLFPSITFRLAYDALCAWRGDRADVEYVRILHLAASTMESTVQVALALLLEQGRPFDYATVRELAAPERHAVPQVQIAAPDLRVYDALVAAGVR
ncbi:MAG: IS21 family transposase [Polyangiaceae bacterium]|nr:IS21 family transposase [Polyangiaceae bacterium]